MTFARNIAFLPNLAEACDRINARAKAENEAEERAHAVERARQIIRNPRGYTDDQLRTACMWFMAYGDGGPDYLLADQHLFAINRRRAQAVNKAQCQAALARIDDREERARLALAWKKVGLVTVGVLLALAVAVVLAGLGWVR